MVFEYKGCKTVFDDKWFSNVSYEEFELVCLDSKTFKLMPLKERMTKIKEAYGRVNRVSKEIEKVGHPKDVRSDNSGPRTGDSTAEQRPDAIREEHQKPKDKAKVQKQIIRKEKGEAKL